MKYNCDIISDLLPLYMDNACTTASAQAVEEHLSECSACTRMLEDMKNSEKDINNEIIRERDEVLTKQAKYFKRRSVLAGAIIGGIFAIPILVCLIVNLATGAGLTWFFIVLTAMFIPASLTIVPLVVPEKKALWTIGSFSASLVVLLGVICIYTGGSWFFTALTGLMLFASLSAVPSLVPRNKVLWTIGAFSFSLFALLAVVCFSTGGSWFLMTASAVLFGLSIPFMPVVVNTRPAAKLLGNKKSLAVMAVCTVTYILMMICIGLHTGSRDFAALAFAYSVPSLAYIWSMFAVIRFVKFNGFIKAAICIFISALFYFFGDSIVCLLLGDGVSLPDFDLSADNAAEYLNNAVNLAGLVLGTVVSAVFAAVGIYKQKKENKKS